MCAVSMIMDQWRQPGTANFIPMQQWMHDPVLASQMLEVLKNLEAIDKRLGLLEQCKYSKPEKDGFKKKLRRAARASK